MHLSSLALLAVMVVSSHELLLRRLRRAAATELVFSTWSEAWRAAHVATRRQHASLHISSARSPLFKWWLALVEGITLRICKGVDLSWTLASSCASALCVASLVTSLAVGIMASRSSLIL